MSQRKSVYSIPHPSGVRFVFPGATESFLLGKLMLWNYEPVMKEMLEMESQLLAAFKEVPPHTKCCADITGSAQTPQGEN